MHLNLKNADGAAVDDRETLHIPQFQNNCSLLSRRARRQPMPATNRRHSHSGRHSHSAGSVARVSTAASRAHASQAREVTPGLSAAPWGAAERAAAWEQRWDKVGAERQRTSHWGHVPVRPTAVRPAWASEQQPGSDSDGSGVGLAIGAYDRAAYARQEKEDAAFLAANERRKRDVLVAELARLQAEVDSLDRQVYEAGEARRFAGRLFHDESQHSQIGAFRRSPGCNTGSERSSKTDCAPLPQTFRATLW